MADDKAEIEASRIKAGLCPKCGDRVKDKGSYMRCMSCPWSLTSGSYDQEGGWCVQYEDDSGPD